MPDLMDVQFVGLRRSLVPGPVEGPVDLGRDLAPVGFALGDDFSEPSKRRGVRHIDLRTQEVRLARNGPYYIPITSRNRSMKSRFPSAGVIE